MAALITMTRKGGVLYDDDDRSQFGGTPTPIRKRASLAAEPTTRPEQRVAPRQQQHMSADAQTTRAPITNDLDAEYEEEEYETPSRGIVTRGGNSRPRVKTIGKIMTQGEKQRWQDRNSTRIGIAIGVLFAVYTIAYWVVFGCISLYNVIAYSPTHTYNQDTLIGGQATHITTVNDAGTIYITFYQKQTDGTTKATSYQGPVLDRSMWGDMNGIVATTEVQFSKGSLYPTIQVNLIGNPDYFHLIFARPTKNFSLVADQKGTYTVHV